MVAGVSRDTETPARRAKLDAWQRPSIDERDGMNREVAPLVRALRVAGEIVVLGAAIGLWLMLWTLLSYGG